MNYFIYPLSKRELSRELQLSRGFKTWNSNREQDAISIWEPNVGNIKTV
jgi:hypothetical protein